MKCKKCNNGVLINDLCNDHFIEYFENIVKKTIKEYNLIEKDDKIIVATSGGKDSITILYLLNKFYNNVEALCIDEGIKGYRSKTLLTLKQFCKEYNIKLNVYSYKKEFGHSLDYFMDLISKYNKIKKLNIKPCTICGIFRRYMINKYSTGFDKSATGHNLDDESQAILMNLLKNQIPILARFGPLTGISNENLFVPRIKPLYFLSEKEILTYSYLKKFDLFYTECPYVPQAFRAEVRDNLNEISKSKTNEIKLNIVNNFLEISKKLKSKYKDTIQINFCTICNIATNKKICNKCELIEKINMVKKECKL